jgi:creatine kinase
MGSEALFGFPTARCPIRLPSLSIRNSFAAQVLKENPRIYDELRTRKTSSYGITLAPCIKPTFDDRSNSDELFPGLVACDAECFTTFSEIFDPVIKQIHPGWKGRKQFLSSNPAKLTKTRIDPQYIVEVHVEARRNLSGLRLAPVCERSERRQVEQVIVRSLLALEGRWSGTYMPLSWSESYEAKPGMTLEEQAQLRDEGLLFLEPTQPARLSMGLGKDWPDARGIFLNHSRDFYVWVNEEDHICLSMKGGTLYQTYEKTIEAMGLFEQELLKQGCSFMKDDRLGFLTVSPAKLGTGLTCAVTLKLPNLGKHVKFNALCRKLHLTATWRTGAWKLTNLPSLGISEVDLASAVIEGCSLLVTLEQKLANGSSIDSELKPFIS